MFAVAFSDASASGRETIEHLEADYLVIGAGAVGMAFVDTMLDETDATFVIVDRHHMPGGHWNDAYPFVRLHQPSAFYGVGSRDLGSNRIDQGGPNEGFYELASGAEVSAYFEQVMRERFLTSGRVRYFPLCEVIEPAEAGHAQRNDEPRPVAGHFRSLISDAAYTVSVGKRIVDGSFFNTSVPSTHTRKYAVADDVTCVTPNEAPNAAIGRRRFTIIGGGKTAMDVGVWLIGHGADPDAITWVVPRDSWLINRETTQPGIEFFEKSIGGFAAQLDAMVAATSIEDLFLRFEAAGVMLRVDPTVTPSMCHYATISQGEVDTLRQIKNVVRGERVSRLESDRMIMQSGAEIPAAADALYIDCSATAVVFGDSKTRTVFEEGRITLQAVRAPLVTTSAAMIAFVEANFGDDPEKNDLCRPVELADTPAEWAASFVANMVNQNSWSRNPKIRNWMNSTRLDPFSMMIRNIDPDDAPKMETLKGMREKVMPAVMNLHQVIANHDAA